MVEHDPLEDMQPKTATAVLMRVNFLWIGLMQQYVAVIIIIIKFINCEAGVPCRNGDVRRKFALARADDSRARDESSPFQVQSYFCQLYH